MAPAQHGFLNAIDKYEFHSKHNNKVTYSDSFLYVLFYKIIAMYYFYSELIIVSWL